MNSGDNFVCTSGVTIVWDDTVGIAVPMEEEMEEAPTSEEDLKKIRAREKSRLAISRKAQRHAPPWARK